MFHKSVLTVLTVCLSATVCLAEDPSFPRPTKSVQYVENQYIVEFDGDGVFEEVKRSILKHNEDVHVVRNIDSRNIAVCRFSDKKAAAKWRESTAGIKYFEADSLVYPDKISSSSQDSVPRKLAETTPYGIGHVKAEAVSDDDASTRKVCVVDSGYDMGHEDLPFDDTNTQITGESFVSGYDWSTDENSHGTHVTGTIAAIGGNDIGVKGVLRNGNVKLHISKVFPASGVAAWSTIIAGFESCVQNGANVINMSLGGSDYTQSFADAIEDAYNAGIVTFALSGNSYGTSYNYPASFPFVLSVGSITESYVRSSFSTYNDEVDLCAPGSSVLSTTPGNNYASYSGTSMASPHAAGVAALVWSLYPDLNHEALINILETTATDLPLGAPDGYDNEYGHGLVDAEAAAEAVLSSAVPTVSPAPSLSSVPSLSPSLSSAPSNTLFTLETTFADNNGNRGQMFTITALEDITILSLDIHTSSTTPITVEILTKEGGHINFEQDDTAWSQHLLATGILGKGTGNPTIIPDEIFPPIDVEEGQERSFYIVLESSASLRYTNGDESFSDQYLQIDTGTGISDRFGATFYPRVWNGRIHYTPNIAVPTVSPAPSLSSVPSNTPSVSIVPSSTPSDVCQGSIQATVEIFTDDFPDETSWDIKDADGAVVASRNSFPVGSTLYEDTVCLAETAACSGSDYTFTISDTYGDGICCAWGSGFYKVTVEDVIHADDPFRSGLSYSTSLCSPSCSTNGSENECNEVDTRNCYWNSKLGECRECSSISALPFPQTRRRRCNYYGCSWNRIDNSCE